ncbi:TPA: hypothetical protein ACKP7S_000802 [Stenotrophomonas maltophilia]
MAETVLGMTDLQIKLFTAIGQILVAAAVGLIAWRQWRTAQQQADTARKKLILDLFDRRIGLFEQLEGLLSELEKKTNPHLTYVQIHYLTGKMAWTFGPGLVHQFERDVLPAFNDYLNADDAVELARSEEERTQAREHLLHAMEELPAAWSRLRGIFSNSLTLLD